MADTLISFLTLLAGPQPAERLLEVRYRTNGHPGMGQYFIPASQPVRASEAIRPLTAHGDTYVGVLLRDRPNGGRKAVSDSHLLWVEIDTTDAYKRLLSAPAAPTAVVSSGTPGHLHAYWLLRQPVSAERVAELNRKLAGSIGGDLASVDPARILRPPATLNHKSDPPLTTTLELLDPARSYDSVELTRGLIDPRPKPLYTAPLMRRPRPGGEAPRWQQVDDELRQIPASEYLERLSGQALNAEGKIRCPFHGAGKERTPSLQVYPPFEWACFGCQQGGSIYDFASHLWAIPTKGPRFRELRDRLAEVFGIKAGEKPRTNQAPVPAGFHG
jgi:hypothetical protein